MGVLETALPIGWNGDAKVLPVQAVPGLRQVGNLQRAVYELLFQLIAHHNVHTVGELVRLRADEGGAGLVDRPPEALGVHTLKLLRKQLPELWEDALNEGKGTPDDVLEEAALALVKTHGGAAGEQGVVVFAVATQLINGVSSLVNHGVHRGGHVVLKVVGGDSHVQIAEAGGIGMLRLGDSAVEPVQAQNVHEIVGELSLLRHRIVGEEEAVVYGGRRLDPGDQGHQLLPEKGEERIQGLRGHALLILVEKGVIGLEGRIEVSGKPAVIIHNLFQVRRKQGKIVFLLGPGPHALGLVHQNAVVHILLGRNSGDLVIGLPEQLRLPAGLGVQQGGVGFQKGQQRPVFRIGGQIVDCLVEDGHGAAPAFKGISGSGGGGVQIQNTDGVTIGEEPVFYFPEGRKGIGNIFVHIVLLLRLYFACLT